MRVFRVAAIAALLFGSTIFGPTPATAEVESGEVGEEAETGDDSVVEERRSAVRQPVQPTVGSGSTSGGTIVVHKNGCNLASAIQAANDNQPVGGCPAGRGHDTILIMMGLTDIEEDLPEVTEDLTIAGGHQFPSPILGKSNNPGLFFNSGIFRSSEDARLVLKNLVIRDGYNQQGNGGAVAAKGFLTVDSVQFINNYSKFEGGAIWAEGSFTVKNSLFENNDAAVLGGAIASSATFQVENSVFRHNDAGLQDDDPLIDDTTDAPHPSGFGGAIFSSLSGRSAIINESIFTENRAGSHGAVFFQDDQPCSSPVYACGAVYARGLTLTGNRSDSGGAAIAGHEVSIDLSDTSFHDNEVIGSEDTDAHLIAVTGGKGFARIQRVLATVDPARGLLGIQTGYSIAISYGANGHIRDTHIRGNSGMNAELVTIDYFDEEDNFATFTQEQDPNIAIEVRPSIERPPRVQTPGDESLLSNSGTTKFCIEDVGFETYDLTVNGVTVTLDATGNNTPELCNEFENLPTDGSTVEVSVGESGSVDTTLSEYATPQILSQTNGEILVTEQCRLELAMIAADLDLGSPQCPAGVSGEDTIRITPEAFADMESPHRSWAQTETSFFPANEQPLVIAGPGQSLVFGGSFVGGKRFFLSGAPPAFNPAPYVEPGPLTIRDWTLTGHGFASAALNPSDYGGLIATAGALKLERVTLRGAEANSGGNLYASGLEALPFTECSDAVVQITDSTIVRGLASTGGGASFINTSVCIENSDIELNNSTTRGGGLAFSDSEARVVDSRLTENYAIPIVSNDFQGRGASMSTSGGRVVVERSTIFGTRQFSESEISGAQVVEYDEETGEVVSRTGELTISNSDISNSWTDHLFDLSNVNTTLENTSIRLGLRSEESVFRLHRNVALDLIQSVIDGPNQSGQGPKHLFWMNSADSFTTYGASRIGLTRTSIRATGITQAFKSEVPSLFNENPPRVYIIEDFEFKDSLIDIGNGLCGGLDLDNEPEISFLSMVASGTTVVASGDDSCNSDDIQIGVEQLEEVEQDPPLNDLPFVPAQPGVRDVVGLKEIGELIDDAPPYQLFQAGLDEKDGVYTLVPGSTIIDNNALLTNPCSGTVDIFNQPTIGDCLPGAYQPPLGGPMVTYTTSAGTDDIEASGSYLTIELDVPIPKVNRIDLNGFPADAVPTVVCIDSDYTGSLTCNHPYTAIGNIISFTNQPQIARIWVKPAVAIESATFTSSP